jgi:tetratricopeptide (TPR) repeat protein
MTKKKRGRKERKAREANLDSTERRESEELPDLTVLPDPRAMERMSANIGKLLEEQQFDSIEEAQAFLDQTLLEGGGLLPEAPAPNTPLEKAQAMVYEALETESARKRRQLARRALKTSGDCADACVLLAEEDTGSLEETRELYQKGVEAGERALGRETFEEDGGYFWGILEIRPYMRARQGLAFCLWELGERQAPIDHYKRMLDLNCRLLQHHEARAGQLIKRILEDESNPFRELPDGSLSRICSGDVYPAGELPVEEVRDIAGDQAVEAGFARLGEAGDPNEASLLDAATQVPEGRLVLLRGVGESEVFDLYQAHTKSA